MINLAKTKGILTIFHIILHMHHHKRRYSIIKSKTLDLTKHPIQGNILIDNIDLKIV